MQVKRSELVLDPAKAAEGIGEIVTKPGYVRVVADGTTVAYIRRTSVSVPAALVARAPKRLGAFKLESNGRWAGVAVADTVAARRVLEYVAVRKEEK